MTITSHITVAIKPQLYKSNLNFGALEPGRILKLRIIGLNGDRALIDLGNYRTTADIKIPVTLGQELTVQVLGADRQLKLGVINTDQEIPRSADLPGRPTAILSDDNISKFQQVLSRILSQFPSSSATSRMPLSIFNVLATLNSYFEPFELKEIMAELLPRLKAHFENSGIFFEKSLEAILSRVMQDTDGPLARNPAELAEVKAVFKRDLKPNLLLLQRFIEGKENLPKIFDPSTLDSLKAAVASMLSDIAR